MLKTLYANSLVNYLEIKMNKKDKELDEFFASLKEPTDTSEQPLAPLIAMPGPNKYVPAQRTQPHLLVQGAPEGYSMQDGYYTYDLTSGGTHHPMGAHPAMTAVADPVLGSPQPQMAAPMNASEAVLTRISQANGGGTPVIDPTVRVPDAIVNGQPAAVPVFNGRPDVLIGNQPAVQGPREYPEGPTIEIASSPHPQNLTNVVRDGFGRPIQNTAGDYWMSNQNIPQGGRPATGGAKGAGGK